MNFLTHLECGKCARHHDPHQLHNVCEECGKPLLCRYDMDGIAGALRKEELSGRAPSMWRYRELLPVVDDANIVTLGEGMTPLIPARRLAERIGIGNLLVKDEGQIPTGTFKARGLCAAVSRAKELGVA